MTGPELRPIADGMTPEPREPDPQGARHIDTASQRAHQLERARKLTRRLGVRVIVDETGWLRGIELNYTRGPGSTIRPVALRIGRHTPYDKLLTSGGIIGRCARYNDALHELRRLATRLEAIARPPRLALEPGSAIWQARRELSRLDDLIGSRQQARMGHGVVNLATLTEETEYFEGRVTHLTPIVTATEAMSASQLPTRGTR